MKEIDSEKETIQFAIVNLKCENFSLLMFPAGNRISIAKKCYLQISKEKRLKYPLLAKYIRM